MLCLAYLLDCLLALLLYCALFECCLLTCFASICFNYLLCLACSLDCLFACFSLLSAWLLLCWCQQLTRMTAIKWPLAGWSAQLCEVLAKHDLLLLCMACSLVFTKKVGWLVGRLVGSIAHGVWLCFDDLFDLLVRVLMRVAQESDFEIGFARPELMKFSNYREILCKLQLSMIFQEASPRG